MAFSANKLINDPNDVVTEFIVGLVETYPGLQYLNGFPEVKVVLRADVSSTSYDKVAVISGGGSGHEPAHAGFVGEGMLTAAICGDVFASPTADSILNGIRAVTGPKGCLLIVKNYTSDCSNFGLAAEQAKSEGHEVEMVIVGDDCALPPPDGIAGRRGLAGTILVHKVAGAAAAAGLALADVYAEAKHASELVGTMGVAVSVCTLPGQIASNRLGPGKMELGLGINGESVAAVADLQPVNVVVSHILRQILSSETNYVSITRGSRVVVMVNGLGTTPVMELMIAAGKAVQTLKLEHELTVDRVYTGSFLTSLDMAGFSISIMKVDEGILQRLDAVTKAPYWPVGVEGTHPRPKTPIPLPLSRSTKSDEDVLSTRKFWIKIGWDGEANMEEEELIREFPVLASQLDSGRGAKDNPILFRANMLTTRILSDLKECWQTYQSIEETMERESYIHEEFRVLEDAMLETVILGVGLLRHPIENVLKHELGLRANNHWAALARQRDGSEASSATSNAVLGARDRTHGRLLRKLEERK